MKTRLRWLLGAGLLTVAFMVWRVFLYVPTSGSGLGVSKTAKETASGATATGQVYVLADDEIVRHIPEPDPEARRRLLKQLRLAPDPDIVSVAVVWDGTPHLRSIESGFPVVSRRLLHVLIDSLQVPLDRLEGIEVARRIGLAGDWVVRSDADLDQCMSYLEEVVQNSGYPGFRIVRTVQKRRAHDMHGVARVPERPVLIFPPHPEAAPAHDRTGTILAFGKALSAAIQRPVAIHAEPKDIKLAWQDNSRAYLDLGTNISSEMVSGLLSDISAALGVMFTDSEVEMTVWQLELNK